MKIPSKLIKRNHWNICNQASATKMSNLVSKNPRCLWPSQAIAETSRSPLWGQTYNYCHLLVCCYSTARVPHSESLIVDIHIWWRHQRKTHFIPTKVYFTDLTAFTLVTTMFFPTPVTLLYVRIHIITLPVYFYLRMLFFFQYFAAMDISHPRQPSCGGNKFKMSKSSKKRNFYKVYLFLSLCSQCHWQYWIHMYI